jgi:hypothetical protein
MLQPIAYIEPMTFQFFFCLKDEGWRKLVAFLSYFLLKAAMKIYSLRENVTIMR